MKRRLFVATVFGLSMVGYSVSAPKETPVFASAKAMKVEGEVTVRADEKTAPVSVKVGESYPAGTVVTTGRKAFVDMEFSPQNQFRILSNSTVTIQPDTKNPKLVALKVQAGEVESNLGAFPKGCKYEVQTPVAVCGAVGTVYRVSYVITEKGVATFVVDDREGHVTVRNEAGGLKVEGKGLSPGQTLTVTLTRSGAGWSAAATFTGPPGSKIMLNMWGIRQQLAIPKGAPTIGGGPVAGGNASEPAAAGIVASTAIQITLPAYINPLPNTGQLVPQGTDGGNGPLPSPGLGPSPLPPPPLFDVPAKPIQPSHPQPPPPPPPPTGGT
jgi:FecR protein